MSSTGERHELDAWTRLAIYRQRYDIEDRLGPIDGLERSIQRRGVRSAAAQRRVDELETLLAEAQRELRTLEREIEKTRRFGAHFIDEILDQVRIDHREAWTPRPVRGFRMWQVNDDGLYGAKTRWQTPTLDAICLRDIPGDDIPHSARRCGVPACGIYATKRVELFPQGVSGRLESDKAIGVVAMTGKVFEHTHGYRCARATVIAIVARWRTHWLMTDDPELIRELAADPQHTIRDSGKRGFPADSTIDSFLNNTRAKEETWI